MNHRHNLVTENSGRNSDAANSEAERNSADSTAPNVVPIKAKPARTPAQQAAVDAYWERARNTSSLPYITLVPGTDDKPCSLSFEGVDSNTGHILLASALGVHDAGMISSLIGQIATGLNAIEAKQDQAVNYVLQTVAAMKPKDAVETFLFVQMALVQLATTVQAKELWKRYPPHIAEAKERSFNRLARTYAAQMQTLKLYRSTGKQRIVVKHVTVNEGGQAIVGDVNTGGGGAKKDTATP